MSEVVQSVDPIKFTEAASLKVKELIVEEGDNSLSLRVYITGGGCSGFQYAIAFDNEVKEDDMVITKNGVRLLV
ncbi:iron-sulfur cluster biosynthesis family protein, partial [Francisella tularensis]|uniref:iron-sulfur cluster biosynthesis family protein n=1 Tax=Francisella tularensis TaxID=263 RepID=UPI002381A41D